MITKIKIENFKSIDSLELELGRLNVFIGANGSGKSNILEGIAFGSAAIADKLGNEFLGHRIRVTEYELMKSAFQKNNHNYKVNLIFETNTGRPIKLDLFYQNNKWHIKFKSNSNTPISLDKYIKQSQNEYDIIEELINNQESLSDERKDAIQSYLEQEFYKLYSKKENLDDFLIYAPENSILRNFREEGQILPLGIKGEGLFSLIVKIFKEKPKSFEVINEYLDLLLDWFDGFEIPNDLMFTEKRIKIKDRNLGEGLQYIDQRSANEGFLYLLFYLTLFISDETPKFFAIDNIDNAMNPKMGSELVHLLSKLAKEHDKQVILTTHNPSVLDGLDLSDDDQRLFVISRNKKGHTQAIRVPHRESEERLSYRFIRGSIGGLPKNF